jgi:hypothetical protein
MPEPLQDVLLLATALALAALSVVVVMLAVRAIFQHQQQPRKLDVRFPDREPLTLDRFYERFYSGSGYPRELVAEVLIRFARAVHTNPEFVRPTDCVQPMNGGGRRDYEELAVDTAVALKDAESRLGVTLSEGPLTTLDDFIRAHALAARLLK